MAKSDLYSNPLIPIVLVAGVLSGSLWRHSTADTGAGRFEAAAPTNRMVPPRPFVVSDLRPVLESLDEALGARSGQRRQPRAAPGPTVSCRAKETREIRQLLERCLVCGPPQFCFEPG